MTNGVLSVMPSFAYAEIFIKDSCIRGNKGKTVFYAYSSNTITISNSTIDDDIFTSGRTYRSVTVNKTLEITFINALSYIVTQICDSYFDSYGTLTVNPNIPSRSSLYLIFTNLNFRDFLIICFVVF